MFYFLDRSDFFTNFLDTAGEELEKTTNIISLAKLQNLFDMSVKSSSTSQLSLTEIITLELDSKTLSENVLKTSDISKRTSFQNFSTADTNTSFSLSSSPRNKLLQNDTFDDLQGTKGKRQPSKGFLNIYIFKS